MSAQAAENSQQHANVNIPQIGEYIFYPDRGLSVVGGIKEEEVVGVKFQGVVIRPINDLQSPITIPLNKLQTSKIRKVATAEEMERALNVLKEQSVTNKGTRWIHRKKQIEEAISSNDIERIAEVVKDSIIPFRNNKLALNELSYSEAQLFEKALDILADHLAFNSGLSRSNAIEHIKTLAHKPRKTDLWPAQKSAPLSTVMSDADFEDLFGVTKEAASVGEINFEVKGESALVKAKTHKKGGSTNVTMKRPTQSGARKSSDEALRITKKDQQKDDVYRREIRHYAGGGVSAKAFEFALVRLEPRQAEILSMFMTRPAQHRMTTGDIAKHFELDEDVVKSIITQSMNNLRKYAQYDRKISLMNRMSAWYSSLTKAAPDLVGRNVKPENKAFFDQEINADSMPSRGTPKAAFLDAAQLLDQHEFEIITLLKIRMPDYRLTLEQVAEKYNISVERVIEIHDQAAKKLRASAEERRQGKGFTRMPSVYQDWASFVEKPTPNKVPKSVFVLEHNQDMFDQELAQGNVVTTGRLKSAFETSAGLLEEDEFEVMMKLELRSPRKRQSLDSIADEMGITRDEVIRIRDRAAEKLSKHFDENHSSWSNGTKFRVHLPWEEAQLSPSAKAWAAKNEDVYVLEHNLQAYNREKEAGNLPSRGELKSLFGKAAGLLDAHEYEALIRLDFRNPIYREIPSKAAEDLGITEEELIEKRDSGAQKLADKFLEKDAHGNPVREKYPHAFKPWREAMKPQSQRAHKIAFKMVSMLPGKQGEDMARVQVDIPAELVRQGKVLAVEFSDARDNRGKPVVERVVVVDADNSNAINFDKN